MLQFLPQYSFTCISNFTIYLFNIHCIIVSQRILTMFVGVWHSIISTTQHKVSATTSTSIVRVLWLHYKQHWSVDTEKHTTLDKHTSSAHSRQLLCEYFWTYIYKLYYNWTICNTSFYLTVNISWLIIYCFSVFLVTSPSMVLVINVLTN